MTHDLTGTTQDVTHALTYNAASQIATLQRSNDLYAWNGAVAVNRPYTTNGLNQATVAGAVSLGYDARGNLTSSGSNTYTYTSENRMAGGGGASLAYDSIGRLSQVSSAAVPNLDYVGQQLIAEREQVGAYAIRRRYVYGAGADEPIVWYEGSGTTDRRWLHADERGSVTAVTNSAGSTIGINAYDEYGIPAAANIGRFQYTGQTWIPELGMYYYKARMYSATLGRFMQADPVGYAAGMNIYAYVGGDPVNNADPSGLGSERPCAGNPQLCQPTIPVGDIIVRGERCNEGCQSIGSFNKELTLVTARNQMTIEQRPHGEFGDKTAEDPDFCNTKGPDGTTINQRVKQTRQEMREDTERGTRYQNEKTNVFPLTAGRAWNRLKPGGEWDSTDRGRGQRLLGAIFKEIGIPLFIGKGVGDILEIAEFLGLKESNDRYPGILDSPTAKLQMEEGARCRGN